MARKLLIDDEEIEVEDGLTLLQACEQAGREIPRFCYHERLSIAGNCRMCLVQVDGMPKPVASCAMGVNDLRPTRDGTPNRIDTRTPLVKKAREGVMEFLLINHPLDCPICDQGGECDLQDQAMAYGAGGSRYDENKRAVDEKYLGPLIKTHMTRCIQCTRCVRFMTEIAGVEELGAAGRGEDMEITTYLEHGMMSELSANVADLCPVGALTHRPTAHAVRPWELRKTESIDAMDAVGSAIRVDTRGREVMRILPRINDDVNEEWISDKTRHIADGLRTQRLDQPYVRRQGKLQPATWDEALNVVAERLTTTAPDKVGAIAGDLAACEEIFALKDLMNRLGVSNLDCRADGEALTASHGRAGYVFNTTIAAIDNADAMLLIGANPRLEASVINARIRQHWRNSDLRIGYVGPATDLGYDYEHLGETADVLSGLLDGSHPFAEVLKAAVRPMVVLAPAVTARQDGAAIYAAAARLAGAAMAGKDPDWKAFNVLHTAAGRVGAMDLGFLPPDDGPACATDLDTVFLLSCDSEAVARLKTKFVIYVGTHGDVGAHKANVILPGSAYTEKSATYVNLEGRPQLTGKSAFAPGDAREDWKIIRALSDRVGQTLPYNDLPALRAAMYATAPHLARIGHIEPADQRALAGIAEVGGRLEPSPLQPAIDDFYLTNPIARASAVMAELSALRRATAPKAAAAE
ncbi:MAG: NADH-quinone oxidoreductase subunit NuoG [Alphaproteobacteria bacterium]|nr:NADH-quinone oxidoreductase subunit NuoG [Alphaproteobacteria bacterium]